MYRATLLGLLLALIATGCTRATEATEPPTTTPAPDETAMTAPVIDHDVTTLSGETMSLADYRGQALLIVNTASECGFTPQLGGLEELHQRYSDRGFAVLGFPCNDFGGQEPGTNDEIATFCSNEYGVTFPLFDKVEIRTDTPHPLYATLQTELGDELNGAVQWNFEKFLVDPDGHVVARFGSRTEPLSDELTAAVEAILPR